MLQRGYSSVTSQNAFFQHLPDMKGRLHLLCMVEDHALPGPKQRPAYMSPIRSDNSRSAEPETDVLDSTAPCAQAAGPVVRPPPAALRQRRQQPAAVSRVRGDALQPCRAAVQGDAQAHQRQGQRHGEDVELIEAEAADVTLRSSVGSSCSRSKTEANRDMQKIR